MNWNWFFSALAQSTAAIVGLVGAFVFTKLVNNESAFQEDMRRLRELLRDGTSLSREIDLVSFEWYNGIKRDRALSRLRDELDDDMPEPNAAETYYRKLAFSAFGDRERALDEIQDQIDSYQPSRFPDPSVLVDPSPILERRIDNTEETIQDLWHRTGDHLRRVDEFRSYAKRQPHSSELVSGTILLLFVLFSIGVIYPLGLLPAEGQLNLSISLAAVGSSLASFQGLLLMLVAGAFGWVCGSFYLRNEHLKFEGGDYTALWSYKDRGDYSPYFRAALENAEATEAPANRIIPLDGA